MTNVLQDIFISIMNPMLKISGKISWKVKERFIIMLFLLIIINSWLTRIIGYMPYYKYYTLVGSGAMFIIAILSLDKSLERKKWNRKLVIAWYSLCIIMIISDFMILKKEGYLGYILLFVFPMVTFVWNNHRKKEILVKCLFRAVKCSFYIFATICFLTIPFVSQLRYMAFLTNPNVMAFYLSVVFFVQLTEFDHLIQIQVSIRKCLLFFIEMSVCLFFIFISQSRTTIFAIFLLGILWLALRVLFNKNDKLNIKKYVLFLGVISIVSVIVSFVLLSHLPRQVSKFKDYIGNENLIVYAKVNKEGSKVKPEVSEEEKNAALQQNENVIERVIDTFKSKSLFVITNGRNITWKDYVSEWNLFGHKRNVLKTDHYKWQHAHNNIIHFTYKYGIIILIPYLLLNLINIIYSIFYFKRYRGKICYASFPFIVIVGFNIITLFEALWYPFYTSLAFLYYFGSSFLFQTVLEESKS